MGKPPVDRACLPPHWTVRKREYEDLPLFVRYPDNLDYDDLQHKFPVLVVVTLEFAEVTERGLPVAAYNHSLEPFDMFVVEYFPNKAEGQCVLVETFGGKRHYYAYIHESADIAGFERILGKEFPQQPFAIEVEKPDSTWSFIRRYARDYFHSQTG